MNNCPDGEACQNESLIEDLQYEISNLKSDIETYQKEILSLEKDNDNLADVISDARNEEKDLRKLIDNILYALGLNNWQYEDIVYEIEKRDRKIDELEGENFRLQSQL